MLTKAVLLPIVLRLVLMLGTLVAVQLTYTVFSNDMFIAFNMLTFLVGLHTALSYSVQVDIWETGRTSLGKLFRAIGIGVAIIIGTALVLNTSLLFLLAGLAYILYRFSDRLSFNMLISRGMVMPAYGISIAAIATEIGAFSLLASHLSENFARLLTPSLIAGIIPVLAFCILYLRPSRASVISTNGKTWHGLIFAAHSLAILFVVMIDRIAQNLNPALSYIDANYLLIFSYIGAVYSLGIATLEPQRPRFFDAAKQASSFAEFLVVTGARSFIFPICGLVLVTVCVCVVIAGANGFADPASFSKNARDLLVGSGLFSFFSMLFLLAYFQMYFLSRREFGPIFLSWLVAFVLRLIAMTSLRIDFYLLLSLLAPVAAIAVLFASNTRKPWGKE